MAKKSMIDEANTPDAPFLISIEDFAIEVSSSDRRVELLNAFVRLNTGKDPAKRTHAEWAAALNDFANAPA